MQGIKSCNCHTGIFGRIKGRIGQRDNTKIQQKI